MKLLRRIALLALVGAALVAAALHWPVAVPDYADVRARWRPSDAWLLDRDGNVLDSRRVDFGVRRYAWTPLADVSPALVNAVIGGEDRRFREHGGVDWRSVAGALRDQLWQRRNRGASTITMQLAALLAPAPRARSGVAAWRRKLAQVQTAYALEAHWTKDQILEAYLNLLGFRGEMQGVAAVSGVLLHKTPAGLDAAESELLAALLPEPGAEPERIYRRACARAVAPHVDCDAIRHAGATLFGPRTPAETTDRLAPHLARSLLAQPGERVRTTLDGRTQRLARDALRRQLGELEVRNVRDGAALVVDTATGEVLAYVGSGGPASTADAVDGVRARRQAGSTLKPFLYELAFERRHLTPASLLDDSPIHLDTASGTYIPQDYDHDYKGLVSVRTALASSLNIPAVRTLVITGVEAFRGRLAELGYRLDRDGDYYGYSLALGSAEVSLWEQAAAYRTLARGGLWSQLMVTPNSSPEPDKGVLPSDAAWLIGDILSDRAARAVTFGLDNRLNTAFWSAAKTGTSKDMRDNWCIGWSSRYTVAVWVGNFEGDAMHEVSGVTGAAPVWAELMAALHADATTAPAPAPPAGIVATDVRYEPSVEPPRREHFLAGTQMTTIRAVAAGAGIARIESPANGLVIALDPDIPPARQRVALSAAGAAAGFRFRLDGVRLTTTADREVLWAPQRGAHRLALEDAEGKTLDKVLFTVR